MVSRGVLPKQQSLFIMHDSEPNAVKPSASPHKCVRRIAHCVKENHRCPFQTESLYRDFVPVSLERPGHSSIFSFDARIRESEDIRIGIVEDAVGGPGIQPRSQFHAAIAMGEPYGTRIPAGVSS